MGKNLTPKIVFIIVLVLIAGWTLYPVTKTLKPGIDLAGGTSLRYEINTSGLESNQKKNLSARMITVLRRRIDPASIQNLIWRPLGNSQFEIQMPLASADTRKKRQVYEKLLEEVLRGNVSRAQLMSVMKKPAEDREKLFKKVSAGSEKRLELLKNYATAYGDRAEAWKKRDDLRKAMDVPENLMKSAGINVPGVKANVGKWVGLEDEARTAAIKEFLGGSAGNEGNVDLVGRYTKIYGEWAKVVDDLTESESGKTAKYEAARRELDNLNLTEDQLVFVLEMQPKSERRLEAIAELKEKFPDRADALDKVTKAFDAYRDDRGRLDDPKDLQRMLKGAGILEFRILPIVGGALESDAVTRYAETLKDKGPKYLSDKNYVWCEVENPDKWGVPNSIVGSFGDKLYVLGSNRKNECMLHSVGEKKTWKLEGARPSQDSYGRRAIGFTLNERGGMMFGNVTGKNLKRPLCILLDGLAISAPRIDSVIRTDGIITGSFSETEVQDMVNKLNAGSLPARLVEQPISVKTIGPSIGSDNRDKGIRAGLIGLTSVVACMLIYYILAGSIADVALLVNILFVLAAMALLRATFTLPGIAGIILTIGMSVDANVLIFERIREEQDKGSSLRVAIRNGYDRAFRTILDANLTTFITAAILYWRASEEVKGFAIVLMLGIASSMFTALFVTRVIFDLLLSKRLIKEHLVMLRLIHEPKINWMHARPIFFCISLVLIVGGLVVFFTRNDSVNNKYDIEFTGGTNVQINLKDGVELSRDEVESKIHAAGAALGNPALEASNVYSVGEATKVRGDGKKVFKRYAINTTETNKSSATITFGDGVHQSVESVTSAIKKAASKARTRLANLSVVGAGSKGLSYKVSTSQLNRALISDILSSAFPNAEISEPVSEEVVNQVLMSAFEGQLEIQENLHPQIVSVGKVDEAVVEAYPALSEFLGGVKVTFKVDRPVTIDDFRNRLSNLRYKPDTKDIEWYNYRLMSSDSKSGDSSAAVNSLVYVSVGPETDSAGLGADQWSRFVDNESRKIISAGQIETSLPRVTQVDPSIGAEAKTRALIAIVLSLFAIVAYIWVRFGNIRYGIAAIVALVHDVCITLGAVTVCTYVASTSIGQALLIGDFKIDLAMIAAFLTLIGYSLNDTIVVFDRIRENRKKKQLSPQIINNSINQTMSRTLLTSFTTFIVVLIMYIFGGEGLRGFTFAIGFGIIVGTYSSVAIASPILLLAKAKSQSKASK